MERFTTVDPSTDLRLTETREQGLQRARALLRKYIPEGVNLSDELIADRRAEAAREDKQN
jgi:hypothetical protein